MSRAEQAVLGGVLIEPDKFSDIADKVSADDFQNEGNRAFWNALVDLDKANKPLDLVSVGTATGLWDYAKELYANTPSAANIEHYASIVRDDSLTRRLLVAGSEVMGIAKSDGDIREKMDKASTCLMSITQGIADGGIKYANEYMREWFESMEAKVNRKGDLLGVSTGLTDLDKITAGLQPTDLIIVAGRPSMGKTTLALNFAEEIAIRGEQNALVFSMEMSAEQLVNRAVSSVGTVEQDHVRLAELDESEWTAVTKVNGMIVNGGLAIDETPGLTILELRSKARRAHRKKPLSLIVVDYIQLMSGKGENQTQIVAEISRGLKALAKELRVPVVALSQLNRSVGQRSDKRPHMADLRDSGAIEQDADLIMFVYRDEVYNKETRNKGVAEIIVGKQRNGAIGTVFASFQGQYCRFKNFTGEFYEDKPSGKWTGGFDG